MTYFYRDDGLTQQRSSSARDTRPNLYMNREVPADRPDDYARLGEFNSRKARTLGKIAIGRTLIISGDQTIGLETKLGDKTYRAPNDLLIDINTTFVLNVLLTSLETDDLEKDNSGLSFKKIMQASRGYEMRGHDGSIRTDDAAQYFSRVITSLNNYSILHTGDEIIRRNKHGSGPNVLYKIDPDIGLQDNRRKAKYSQDSQDSDR